MKKSVIQTDKAPAAIGPYSQAVVAGNLVFTSGQIPIVPASGNIEAKDIAGQTRQVMANLEAVLKAAKTDFAHVVKSVIFLSDMGNFGAVNEIYAASFQKEPPARSTVQVARLPKDSLVEIEMVAVIP